MFYVGWWIIIAFFLGYSQGKKAKPNLWKRIKQKIVAMMNLFMRKKNKIENEDDIWEEEDLWNN